VHEVDPAVEEYDPAAQSVQELDDVAPVTEEAYPTGH